jgi:hypothetical protein
LVLTWLVSARSSAKRINRYSLVLVKGLVDLLNRLRTVFVPIVYSSALILLDFFLAAVWCRRMTKWLSILLYSFRSPFRTRPDLAFENLLLGQQPAVLKRQRPCPQLSSSDRSFCVLVVK